MFEMLDTKTKFTQTQYTGNFSRHITCAAKALLLQEYTQPFPFLTASHFTQ